MVDYCGYCHALKILKVRIRQNTLNWRSHKITFTLFTFSMRVNLKPFIYQEISVLYILYMVTNIKKLNKGSAFTINSPLGSAGVRGTTVSTEAIPQAGGGKRHFWGSVQILKRYKFCQHYF